VNAIPVSDNFAANINKTSLNSDTLIPSAMSNDYFKKSKFPKKNIFGSQIQMQNESSVNNSPLRGKKMYLGVDKLSYMDRAIDLTQSDYKRFRLGKLADNIIGNFGRRNNSLDPSKKGIKVIFYILGSKFVSLKHPYEWDVKQRNKDPFSYIKSPKKVSPKVNNSSFEKSYYKDNSKNNDPINRGKEIAERMHLMDRDQINRSAFMNTKYIKNFSTIGNNTDQIYNLKGKALEDIKSMTNFFKTKGKKRDVSLKVGENTSVSEHLTCIER